MNDNIERKAVKTSNNDCIWRNNHHHHQNDLDCDDDNNNDKVKSLTMMMMMVVMLAKVGDVDVICNRPAGSCSFFFDSLPLLSVAKNVFGLPSRQKQKREREKDEDSNASGGLEERERERASSLVCTRAELT